MNCFAVMLLSIIFDADPSEPLFILAEYLISHYRDLPKMTRQEILKTHMFLPKQLKNFVCILDFKVLRICVNLAGLQLRFVKTSTSSGIKTLPLKPCLRISALSQKTSLIRISSWNRLMWLPT